MLSDDDETSDSRLNQSWPDLVWLVAGICSIGGAIWFWFAFAS
jgi:hypothetical protein